MIHSALPFQKEYFLIKRIEIELKKERGGFLGTTI